MGTDDRESAADRTMRLAEERTRLARERTTLAHIRTGFASFLFGTAVLGLFGTLGAVVVGGLFVFVGVLFLATGLRSYVLSNRRTQSFVHDVEESVRWW